MVIISYTGLDLFLIGELNAKIHSQVSNLLETSEEEVVFSSYDSFVYYKGHEQTSIQLIIKVEMDEKYRPFQKQLAELLLKSSEEYSIHATVYFNYFNSEDSYSRVNPNYPRYLTSENERSEEEYDEEVEYSEDELFTGNIFQEFEVDEDEEPQSFDSLLKK